MGKRNPVLVLNDLKLWLSQATLASADLKTIRLKSLSNLLRWKAQGTWGCVYEEWLELMTQGSDLHVIHVMTSQDDEPNRMRQSMPFVGIVDEQTRSAVFLRYRLALARNEK